MAKKGDLTLKQMALSWLEFQCVPFQTPVSQRWQSGGHSAPQRSWKKDQDVV